MILISLGGNLFSRWGAPIDTLNLALARLEAEGVRVSGRSNWYRSKAVPDPSDPDFYNAVVAVETADPPDRLLARCHRIERSFGRVRRVKWEARPIDLDLIDYNGLVTGEPQCPEKGLVLPHPRLVDRPFVLVPLQEVAPEWRHPVSGETVSALIASLKQRTKGPNAAPWSLERLEHEPGKSDVEPRMTGESG